MTFTPISEVGGFGLIDRLRHVLGRPADEALVVGIGDDGAVYHAGKGVQVITTDLLIEGVHFDRTFTSMRFIGWKSIAVNVSDIAAMNAHRLLQFGLIERSISAVEVKNLEEGLYDGFRVGPTTPKTRSCDGPGRSIVPLAPAPEPGFVSSSIDADPPEAGLSDTEDDIGFTTPRRRDDDEWSLGS